MFEVVAPLLSECIMGMSLTGKLFLYNIKHLNLSFKQY